MKNKHKKRQAKQLRPEEIYQSPLKYYDEEMVEKYATSSSIKKTQQIHTTKLVEMINLFKPKRILDLGCGVGFSMEILIENGFEVIGIDINRYMLKKTKEKRLKVILGDFRELRECFKKERFDAVISVSAIQWTKDKNNIKKVVEGINLVLKPKGVDGIQSYQFSSYDVDPWEKTFKKSFLTRTIIENPNNPKKRNIYLVIRKKKNIQYFFTSKNLKKIFYGNF